MNPQRLAKWRLLRLFFPLPGYCPAFPACQLSRFGCPLVCGAFAMGLFAAARSNFAPPLRRHRSESLAFLGGQGVLLHSLRYSPSVSYPLVIVFSSVIRIDELHRSYEQQWRKVTSQKKICLVSQCNRQDVYIVCSVSISIQKILRALL